MQNPRVFRLGGFAGPTPDWSLERVLDGTSNRIHVPCAAVRLASCAGRTTKTPAVGLVFLWFRDMDSNHGSRLQRPLSCR